MICTEEEASQKHCPFFFGNNDTPDLYCVGSACMAWREVPEEIENTETLPGRSPPGEGWYQLERGNSPGLRWQRVAQKAGGYCGKIGKP